MLFQTISFVALFTGTIAGYYWLPRRYRLAVLGASSLVFYFVSGALDFILLIGTLSITYHLSRRVKPSGPRWPVVAGVLILFVSLAYFKYADFFYQNADALLIWLNLAPLPRFASTILPLGISFYTFQIVAYLVDLHAGRAEQSRSFLHYVVFIMFFGQLIAGPIMRASDFLGQLTELRGASRNDIQVGVTLILVGLVKKVVIADNLAVMVDTRFSEVGSVVQADAWIAAYLFAFQIFFDFSGYVSIALGLGRLLGLNLTENFRTPYLSRGPSEFWARWHVTLSRWFRDYLYIPLGGSRRGRARELVNLMAVMTIAGLWHGAGWQFALWGAVHGSYLCIARFIPTARLKALVPVSERYQVSVYDAMSTFVFFHLVVLAWIPFRSPDLSTTLKITSAAFRFDGLAAWADQTGVLALVLALFAIHIAERAMTERFMVRIETNSLLPRLATGVSIASIILVILIGLGTPGNEFIYFRF